MKKLFTSLFMIAVGITTILATAYAAPNIAVVMGSILIATGIFELILWCIKKYKTLQQCKIIGIVQKTNNEDTQASRAASAAAEDRAQAKTQAKASNKAKD